MKRIKLRQKAEETKVTLCGDLDVKVRRLPFFQMMQLVREHLGDLLQNTRKGQAASEVARVLANVETLAVARDVAMAFVEAGGLVAWDMIEDETGEPIELTRETAYLFFMHEEDGEPVGLGYAVDLVVKVIVPQIDRLAAREAEKNASAPLPSGSLAGARNTAKAAGKPAKSAHSRSTTRIRPKASKSGT